MWWEIPQIFGRILPKITWNKLFQYLLCNFTIFPCILAVVSTKLDFGTSLIHKEHFQSASLTCLFDISFFHTFFDQLWDLRISNESLQIAHVFSNTNWNSLQLQFQKKRLVSDNFFEIFVFLPRILLLFMFWFGASPIATFAEVATHATSLSQATSLMTLLNLVLNHIHWAHASWPNPT